MASRVADSPATSTGALASPPRRRRTPRPRSPASAGASPAGAMTASTRACTLCGAEPRDAATAADMMTCDTCGSLFHAKCANLPVPPEAGHVFCAHPCYATFLSRRQGESASGWRPRSDNFPDLVAGIQRVLKDQGENLSQSLPNTPSQHEEQQHLRGRSSMSDVAKSGSSDRMRQDREMDEPDGGRYNAGRAYPNGNRDGGYGGLTPQSTNSTGVISHSRISSSSSIRDNRREPPPQASARPDYGNGAALPSMPGSLAGSGISQTIMGRRGYTTSNPPSESDYSQHSQQDRYSSSRSSAAQLSTLFDKRKSRGQQPLLPEQRADVIDSRSIDRLHEGAMGPMYQSSRRGNKHAWSRSGAQWLLFTILISCYEIQNRHLFETRAKIMKWKTQAVTVIGESRWLRARWVHHLHQRR